ncbi:hypothetical protein HJ590_09300 [Naumannella sp. ID2617S]|nr:hypothetical protein [Naumannella sp. ID2617S]
MDDTPLPLSREGVADVLALFPRRTHRVTGGTLAARLDELGHTKARAARALDQELRLTVGAMAEMPLRVRGRLSWLLEQAPDGSELDADTWRHLFGTLRHSDYAEWLLFLAAECPAPLLVRNCLAARPEGELVLSERWDSSACSGSAGTTLG